MWALLWSLRLSPLVWLYVGNVLWGYSILLLVPWGIGFYKWLVFLEATLNPFDRMASSSVEKNGSRWKFENWGTNQQWEAQDLVRPTSLEELVQIIKENPKGKMKAFGSLHSWSKVAKTDGLAVDVKGLNKVLELDRDAMTVTCEAGMLLHDLFQYLLAEDLALETMPNVGHVTLGGILANAVHGTNSSIGTFGDQVEEFTIVTGNGEVLVLNRNDEDPKMAHYFDACIVSFGTLGIIYSMTIRVIPPYAVYKGAHVMMLDEMIPRIPEIGRTIPDGVQFTIHLPANCAFLFTKRNVSYVTVGSAMMTSRDQTFQMQLSLVYWFFQRPKMMKLVDWFFPYIKDTKVYRWDMAEVYPNHTRRFINMEYGLKEDKIVEALERTFQLIRENPDRSSVTGIVVRIAGRDRRGYLSPTNTDSELTFYIDIPYRAKTDKEREFMGEIEELYLSLGGRVSMARWFVNPNEGLFRNVDDFDKFKEAKRELDPNNIFGNELTDIFLGIN